MKAWRTQAPSLWVRLPANIRNLGFSDSRIMDFLAVGTSGSESNLITILSHVIWPVVRHTPIELSGGIKQEQMWFFSQTLVISKRNGSPKVTHFGAG